MAKTPAVILSEVNALYVANDTGAIEAPELRGTFQDLIALEEQTIAQAATARAGASRVIVKAVGTQDPPNTPALLDAYVLGAVPTGAWADQANAIAHWTGAAWSFITPVEGTEAYNQTDNATYVYSGSAWAASGANDHGGLTGLSDDDHTQYHNNARGDARYDLLGTASAAMAAHIAAADPHTQYLLLAEANALYSVLAHVHAIAGITGLQAALDAKLDDSQATAAGLAIIGAATAAAQTALLDVFTDALKGLVPASGGGTDNFMRADGTWAIPSAVGGGGAPDTADYLVRTSQAGLSAERLVTDSPTVVADWSVAGQVKFNVVGGGSATVPVDFKDSVYVATVANLALSGEQTIDGFLTSGSRVLVKDQTVGSQNGIYVTAAGAWSRATDADSDAEVTPGMLVLVENGTINGDQVFILTTSGTIVVGTTALTFLATAPPTNVFVGKTVNPGTYTHILTDAGKRLYMANAGTKTLTVAPQSSVNSAVNTEIEVYNLGAGLLTIAPGSGVTINSYGSLLTVPQYHCVKLKKRANANTWELTHAVGSAAILDETTAAQYRANTADKALSTDQVWSAAAEVALTDAATIAVDLSTFINASVTLGGNRTLGQPSNLKAGQTGYIRITQDGTGSRTLAYHADWVFAGGTDPTLTTTASAYDLLFYQVLGNSKVFASLIKAIA